MNFGIMIRHYLHKTNNSFYFSKNIFSFKGNSLDSVIS